MNYEMVFNTENLFAAWQHVSTKNSAGGIDDVSVAEYGISIQKNIEALASELKTQDYLPNVYKEISIKKKDGSNRELGLLTVKDKIVQQAIKMVIEPHFEKQFLNVSYGYRPNKGPLKAINRTLDRLKAEKREWITVCDIDNFFNNIPLDPLFDALKQEIQDERLLRLIRLCVQMGKVNKGLDWKETITGLPQGGVLSPLLSNIYLHRLDVFLTAKGYGLVRYSDDFIVLSHSQREAQQALKDIHSFIGRELHLSLNEGSVVKRATNGFHFLGIWFVNNQANIHPDKLADLKAKIAKSISIEDNQIAKKLYQTIDGIARYYGVLMPKQQLEVLDAHLISLLKTAITESYRKKLLKDKKNIENQIFSINFLSEKFNLDKRATARNIILSCRKEKTERPPNPKKVPISEKHAINKRKIEYLKLESAQKELIVSSPGVFIGKNRYMLTVKEHGKKVNEVPLKGLKSLCILSSGVSLSSDVISYCSANKIPIDLVGFDGLPSSKILPPVFEHSDISLLQVAASTNTLGAKFAKSIVKAKICNQVHLIKYIGKYRRAIDPAFADAFDKQITSMENIAHEVTKLKDQSMDEIRPQIMGYEGSAAASYWSMVGILLNGYTSTFTKREHQGATDLVNCMLNYGYGILYSRIHSACVMAHLNPYISCLHVPQQGKPTLIFDLIEQFRQYTVDRIVFAMLTKGEELGMENNFLNYFTKQRLVKKILERFNKEEFFRGKKMKLCDIITEQIQAYVLFLSGKTIIYKPYVAKW